MSGTKRRRDAALDRRAGGVSRIARSRPEAARKAVKRARRDVALVERELAELDEECARVRRLLRRLGAARRAGRDPAEILGDLGVSVLHLHVHTKGLDGLLEVLE